MIIYEINLIINNEIFSDYYHWLVQHIILMLKFPGFQHGEIFEEKQNSEHTHLIVHYIINSENDLNDYLQNYAPTMRTEAILKFGEKFSATRRILKSKLLVHNKI